MNLDKLCRAFSRTSPLLFLLTFSSTAFASVEELPRGTIIERVVCEADVAQSYSLYIPSTYTPQKKWPVIYAFDPGARGDLPVKLFKEAAEKYGYIVAGSYNSQNGMRSVPLQAAISALLNDTRKRLSIDEKRVYTAGFSGGARVAVRVASSCGGCVAGVIACGAGFPPDIRPTQTIPFAFYGTLGLDDFNYPELKKLDIKLAELNIPHRIVTFVGGHEWASSQILIEAVGWMELQAMRIDRRDRDDALIGALWEQYVKHARADEDAKRPYDAYLGYVSLASDFKTLRNVSEIEVKMLALKESNEVKLALKDEQDQLKDQLELARQIIVLGGKLLDDLLDRGNTLKELRSTIDGLRVKAKLKDDSRERRVARRTLRQVFAQTYEAAIFKYLPEKQFDVALINFEVAALIAPDNWQISYEMARSYALSGNKNKALESLKRATEKGFTDAAAIEHERDFESLQSDSSFKGILKRLKQQKPSK